MCAESVEKYAHDPSRTSEWCWYSYSYFEAATVIAEAASASEERFRTLLPPLLFNLRHALELMLKFLAYGTGAQPREISHHDITRLFSLAGKSMRELDDESLDFAASGLGIDRDFLVRGIEAMVWKTEVLTNKYRSYEFLGSPIEDAKNELFRYPSSTSSGSFDLNRLPNDLTSTEVLMDVKDLSGFALFVLVAFGRGEKGLHVLGEMP
jgi:hypothetical protein